MAHDHARFTRLLAATVALACAALAWADSIVLRSSVRLAENETVVRLRDVAYLDGDAAVRLGGTELADLAAGGSQRASLELSIDEIRSKLLAASSSANLIDLSGRTVLVRSAKAGKPVAMKGLAIDPNAAPAIAPAAANATAVAAADSRIEFLAEEATDLTTPRGLIAEVLRNAFAKRGARLRLAIAGTDDRFLDQRAAGFRFEAFPLTSLTADLVRIRVLVRDGDRVVSRTDLAIQPTLEATVATATSSLRKGASLGNAIDVHTEWVKPSEFDAIVPVGAINQGVATTQIAKGERLTSDAVRKPVQIKRNDKVTIRRELGTVAIELVAIAEEDGAVGDLIRFRAVDRKDRRDQRVFFAEVLGSGRAVIREAASTLAAGGDS